MKRFALGLAVLSFVLAACSSKDDRPPAVANPDTGVPVEIDASNMDTAPETAASCTDKVKNNDETDTDCGGSCMACDVGKKCLKADDCDSKNCKSNACAAATCSDGIPNGTETDIDCGGASCNPCADGKKCTDKTHCLSGVCGTDGLCASPTCSDGVKNGVETDIDCGGGGCPKCGVGKRCISPTGADCTTSVCGSDMGTVRCLCPAGMERIGLAEGGGGTYCIDRTEVTADDYASKFFSLGPNPDLQDGWCKDWNRDFAPEKPYETKYAGFPVQGVDWCDAYAYCARQGKVLCGKIGGGATPYTSYADSSADQWFNACSQNGSYVYPYGKLASDYKALSCNGVDQPLGGATSHDRWQDSTPSGYLHTECSGGMLGNVYQLSGNVAEWENSCDASTTGMGGAADNCRVRGGSFDSGATDLRCDADKSLPRNTKALNVGFRCCL